MSKIGLTLYSLRDYCKTPEDLDITLGKVAEMGYRNIQVSGVSLEPAMIREKLDKHGLMCVASHEGLKALREDIPSIIEKLKSFGTDFTALGFPGSPEMVQNSLSELIGILNRAGKELKDTGIRLGYHNHDIEFVKVDGITALERIYDETDPELVYGEIDVHWVQRGGGSPTAWIRKLKGRMPVIHFKDYMVLNSIEPFFAEVGHGNLDWDAIIDACEYAGVDYYIVEQDAPVPGRDIFDSLKMSYDFLADKGE